MSIENIPSPKCYVYDAFKAYELPKEILDKDKTIFYPEKSMTFSQLMHAKRFSKNIVTDSPFLVPLFDFHDVYIYRNNVWVTVCEEIGIQTYGTSYELIIDMIFGFRNSIPLCIVEEIKELIDNSK